MGIFETLIQAGQNLKKKEDEIREKASYMTDKQLLTKVRCTHGYEKMVYMTEAKSRGLSFN